MYVTELFEIDYMIYEYVLKSRFCISNVYLCPHVKRGRAIARRQFTEEVWAYI